MEHIQGKYVYLSCIVRYSKTSTGKLRFDKALVVFECLIQLLSKCFMCRFRKHAVLSNQTKMSTKKKKKNLNCANMARSVWISP